MRHSADPTGMFPFRIFLSESDIESECTYIRGLSGVRNTAALLSTTELQTIAQSVCDYVEFEADLPPGRDAVTRFYASGKIEMLVSREQKFNQRFRMSVAHEIGHAHLHKALFASRFANKGFDDLIFLGDSEQRITETQLSFECAWLEWQANHFAACLLMPQKQFISKALNHSEATSTVLPIYEGTGEARKLFIALSKEFEVSYSAAEIRSRELRCVVPFTGQHNLFD